MNNGLSIGRYLWRRPERLDSCLFCKGRGEVQQLDESWWNWDILDIPINKRCKSLNFRIRFFYVVNFDGYVRDLKLNVILEDQHDTLWWFRRIQIWLKFMNIIDISWEREYIKIHIYSSNLMYAWQIDCAMKDDKKIYKLFSFRNPAHLYGMPINP